MANNFTWRPDGTLPNIHAHTKCKLDVIKQYLDVYFDTVSQSPRMDTLNITLVDGFCGGGAYKDGNGSVWGSPLVMINAVEEAERRINEKRKKRLIIDAKYFFIDANPDHTIQLKKTLAEREYLPRLDNQIKILDGEFEAHLETILQSRGKIHKAIFYLINVAIKMLKNPHSN